MNTKSTIKELEAISKNTLMEIMGIEYVEIGEDYLIGKMPVDKRTHQPLGLLHGGANAALVETLGSIGTYILLDKDKYIATGIEVNVNHLRGVTEGWVYGKATIVHKGRSTHVWQVDITNEQEKLVATGRLTMMIYPKK